MPFVDFFRNSRASLQIFSKGEMQTGDIETFPVPFFFKLFCFFLVEQTTSRE